MQCLNCWICQANAHYEPHHEKTCFLHICKNKGADQMCGNSFLNSKPLAIFCGCTALSDLAGNPEEAHIFQLFVFAFQHGKKNLLLSKYMDNTVFTEASPPTKSSVNKTKTIIKRETGKTVKRKFLSPAQQRVNDSQRQRAIDLYRKIKDKKVTPR